jgi:acyl-CoA synthetase (AMP-forming)/AMP-acid ligase II
VTDMTHSCVYELLDGGVGHDPGAVALGAPGRRPLTYGGLRCHVELIVAQLNDMGLGRNDRIGLMLPNGPELALGLICLSSGATGVPLNPNHTETEYGALLSRLGLKALMTLTGESSPVGSLARSLGVPVIELLPLWDKEAGLFEIEGSTGLRGVSRDSTRGDDVALVLHTSGTTARPKIVPLTQENMYTSALNIAQTLQLSTRDRCLNVLPLFHVHGIMGALFSSIAAGHRG